MVKPTLNFARAQQALRDNSLDVLLATSKRNVSYLSDAPIGSFTAFKLGDNGIPYRCAAAMFVGEEEIPWWINSGRIRVPGGRPSYLEIWEDFAQEVRRRGLERGRIGVEDMHLSYSDYSALRGLLSEAEFVDASWMFLGIRMVKTPAEIAILRRANAITARGMEKAFGAIAEGTPLRRLVEVFRDAVQAEGAVYPHYFALTHTRASRVDQEGPIMLTVAANPDAAIRKGDLIQMDMVVDFQNYYSDISRMACCGEPNEDILDMLGVSQEVHKAITEAVRPGVKGSELYAIGARASKARPYFEIPELTKPALFYDRDDLRAGRYFFHNVGLGHGIGREVHELPYITPALVPGVPDPPLEPNVVLAVEAATTSWSVFNIEDSVLVTETGLEYLSTIGRQILVH